MNRLRKYLLIAMEDILINDHRGLLAVPGQLKKINSLTPVFCNAFYKIMYLVISEIKLTFW